VKKQTSVAKAQLTQEHLQQMLDDIFKREDRNDDGVVSFEEFTGPKHEEL